MDPVEPKESTEPVHSAYFEGESHVEVLRFFASWIERNPDVTLGNVIQFTVGVNGTVYLSFEYGVL